MKYYKPSDLRFAQDSISDHFEDSRYTMEDTFRKLLYYGITCDGITCDQITPLKVVEEGAKLWVTGGNRRLYLYRKLEQLGILEDVPTISRDRKELNGKKTTTTDGQTVKIRLSAGSPDLEERLNSITTAWREARAANDVFVSGSSQEEAPGSSQELNDHNVEYLNDESGRRNRKRGRDAAGRIAGSSRGSNQEALESEENAPATKYRKGKGKQKAKSGYGQMGGGCNGKLDEEDQLRNKRDDRNQKRMTLRSSKKKR